MIAGATLVAVEFALVGGNKCFANLAKDLLQSLERMNLQFLGVVLVNLRTILIIR